MCRLKPKSCIESSRRKEVSFPALASGEEWLHGCVCVRTGAGRGACMMRVRMLEGEESPTSEFSCQLSRALLEKASLASSQFSQLGTKREKALVDICLQ